ncbi:MAG TPA: hypothetical protein DD422_03495 [Akkermansia sp.]|nr:hypothetical protein [Akkermansia sp.]
MGIGPATVFCRCGVFAFPLFLRLLKRDDGKEAWWLMKAAVFLRRVLPAHPAAGVMKGRIRCRFRQVGYMG